MADSLWRSQLQPGRFRNAPFYCNSAKQPLGRRIVVHSYPLRPKPYPEDMGPKHRTYSLELVVVGDDYMPARDRLIAALEEEGPGTLIHPYRGELRVVVIDGEVMESKDEGGMARFTVTFMESGEESQAVATADTAEETEQAADDCDDAAVADFEEEFTIDAQPEFVGNNALAHLNDVLNQVDDLRRQLTPDLTILTDAIAVVAKVRTSLLSLALVPTRLAQGILDAIHGTVLIADSVRNASFGVRSEIFRTGSKRPSKFAGVPVITPADSPSRQQQKRNQAAINRLTQRAYLTQLVRLSVRTEYSSREEAITQRNEVTDLLRDDMENFDMTADTYQAFTRLQATFARHVDVTGTKLERVGQIELKELQPALVTAYAVYGNVDRVDELVDRNKVEHPAFMPAGVPLEVLRG
jgi:prophage DNA circulation protein